MKVKEETIKIMTSMEVKKALGEIKDWKIIADFAVGGLEWIGFSHKKPELLFVISSQKNTVMNCKTGRIIECDLEYDEEEMIAYTDQVEDEAIPLAGQYGGKLKIKTNQGEQIKIEKTNTKNVFRLTFFTKKNEKIKIFENYGLYTYGFSNDDNYFVISSDSGITVMKRNS